MRKLSLLVVLLAAAGLGLSGTASAIDPPWKPKNAVKAAAAPKPAVSRRPPVMSRGPAPGSGPAAGQAAIGHENGTAAGAAHVDTARAKEAALRKRTQL